MACATRQRPGRILRRPSAGLLCALLLTFAACADGGTTSTPGGAAQPLPPFDHIVVVVVENHPYGDIIGSSDAPYINSLAQRGAEFTDSHAVAHPSEPNYLALFAGSTFGLTSDDCPQSFNAPNLGGELLAHNLSFVGYSESLPSPGFTGCDDGNGLYARKHNPWVNFADLPAPSNQPFDAFPRDFTQLPAIPLPLPNLPDHLHPAPPPHRAT